MTNEDFWEDLDDLDLPPEPHSDVMGISNRTNRIKAKIYTPELYLSQKELAYSRLEKIEATEAERIAVVLAARAVITYRRDKSVKKTADEIITEVCEDQVRQVRLLNAVMPMARHLSARGATT